MKPNSTWNPVRTEIFAAVLVFWVLILRFHTKEDNWFPLLDYANLAFHEAGHVFFSIFGETLQFLGGTFGQLAFPIIVIIIYWRKRDPTGYTVGLLWFCQNLFNIARYMADAQAQLLPLVGGGEHDWFYLFSTWGVLAHDTRIASFVRFIGWLGLWATLIRFTMIWWTSERNNSN
jgi:hypothetical protein